MKQTVTVPGDRRPNVWEVLAELARCANSLSPASDEAAALEMAQADALVVRTAAGAAYAAMVKVERHEQALTAGLNAACIAAVAAREARDADGCAEAAALARAEAADRGREEAARELVAVRTEAEAMQRHEEATQEAAAVLRGELESIRAGVAGEAYYCAWQEHSHCTTKY